MKDLELHSNKNLKILINYQFNQLQQFLNGSKNTNN